jgi:hypothetical protein
LLSSEWQGWCQSATDGFPPGVRNHTVAEKLRSQCCWYYLSAAGTYWSSVPHHSRKPGHKGEEEVAVHWVHPHHFCHIHPKAMESH